MDTRNVCGQAGIAGMLLVGCWLAGSATVFGSVLEQSEIIWGGAGAVCVSADYDGDGLVDPALYEANSGQWHVLLSSQYYADTNSSAFLGGPGFEPLLGDFDGDGKNDPAVYDETTGEWFVILSASGYYPVETTVLGGPGYNPVPADYDGDGMTEIAVYQPVTAHWAFCTHVDPEVTDTNVLAVMYSNAMVNASSVVASKIKRDLTYITADNTNLIWRTNSTTGIREVLVASYMAAADATNYYHVGQYTSFRYAQSWVTIVPELKNFCRNYAGTNLYLRLKQLLGLPATGGNTTIVEFYVDPQYLLRPSRDPEITDREAEVSFRTNTPYAAVVSTNYSVWFQSEIISHNYGMTNGVWNAFPWTQLGYTYDWLKTGNNIVGLSEFVLPGKMLYDHYTNTVVLVYVVSITDAANYAAVPNDLVIQPQGSTINIAPRENR
ncbi:MAG: VCBS repeat-containing protein [Verrucomicrobia bacterium]|nr:VCBS repeat-containing protein [Verrucomicrobiota bacterium]MBU1855671.1 VCBS repeat-containing protein [Verrucomicrobiota bacterium]